MNKLFFFKSILIISSLATMLFTLHLGLQHARVGIYGETIAGQVVGYYSTKYNPQSTTNRSKTHAPVILFITNSGRTITFRDTNYSKTKKYKIGDTIEVLHIPNSNAYRLKQPLSPMIVIVFLMGLFLFFWVVKTKRERLLRYMKTGM